MAQENKQTISNDRIPPHSIEAEQSVLGSILLDKESMIKIADVVTPKDFYKKSHKLIYEAMLDLYHDQEPIDVLTVKNRLKDKKQLDEIGGASYLSSLVNSIATPAHVVSYAKTVYKKRVLRDLISVSYSISSLGYREDEDIDMLLDEAERNIFGITQNSLSQSFSHVKNTLDAAFERIEKLHQNDHTMRGVPTGFKKIDNLLSGLQNSDLVILAARPSLGKTSLALNIALNVAKNNIPVGIFSLEMSSEQLVDRLIATEARVDLWKLRTGNLSMDGEYNDFTRISDALGTLSNAPIFFEESSTPNILQMRTMARRLQAEHGLGLLVIDYLQLIQPRNPNDSPVQAISEISRALKGLARELNIPVLALSQLSRAVEQRTARIPKLSDLRDSGSIEQDADVVMFIYREDKDRENTERKNEADIIIAKHRNGPLGIASLYFDQDRATFENLSSDDYQGSSKELSSENLPKDVF
ncbi:MAG: replicative DNA helicase [Patescibacteria group bacterium]